MKQLYTLLVLFIACAANSIAGTLKGGIRDAKTGDAIIGARVELLQTSFGAVSGLDGSYSIRNIPGGSYQMTVHYAGYNDYSTVVNITAGTTIQNVQLSEGSELEELTITANKFGNTDRSVRNMEKNADQVVNILSAQAINLSPDITVANAVQRVSGISIERNSNGDGQYAIVRGMDKRYNYTLVNGVKIPSPDDKYRYVPLDIFPSALLDRLEVYKSLTPSMPGDAVGGAINIAMKDAPDHMTIWANLATGYSELFVNRDFTSFDKGGINWQSPWELYGKTYAASNADLSAAAVDYTRKHPTPNQIAGVALGNRFLNNKLGVMLAGSYQNTYRGSNSLFFDGDAVDTLAGKTLTKIEDRYYSEQQKRLGTHAKLDYKINSRNSLRWYNAYMSLENAQVREGIAKQLTIGGYDPEAGNATLSYTYKTKLTLQKIYNSTLQGDHWITDKLNLKWSAVYSKASSEVPDYANITFLGEEKNFVDTRTYADDSYRRWEHNTDRDLGAYLDLKYDTHMLNMDVNCSIGGIYNDKERNNFYNNYQIRPSDPFAIYDLDFTDFSSFGWTVQNPRGSVATGQNYDATEKIGAGYLQFHASTLRWDVIGGVRAEHTQQGYSMQYPIGEDRPESEQVYTDWLPSLNLKYKYGEHTNFRASYFRSINRPGFSEIIPTPITGPDYKEAGNPDLQHAVADNMDVRYELFPQPEEQLLIGAFFKHIQNPIEYTLQTYGTHNDIVYMPGNFGNATNYGLEIDYIKYFHSFGIKANYTYTKSSITTDKLMRIRDEKGDLVSINVLEERPMYGQSAHIGNITVLYRNEENGIHGQLALNYTGPRINTVDQFVDRDIWQRGFLQLDAAGEKSIGKHFVVYAKVNNILNTPMELFMKNSSSKNDGVPYQEQDGTTLMRRDYYQRSYLVGLRYQIK